jgi:hypothetical protein
MEPSQALFVTDQAQADSSKDEHLDAKDLLVQEALRERVSKSQLEAIQFFVRPEDEGIDPGQGTAMGFNSNSDGG